MTDIVNQKLAVIRSFALIVEDSLQEVATDPEGWLERLKGKLPHLDAKLKAIESCSESQPSLPL